MKNVIHDLHTTLTLLIQKELHKASRCAVISEIANFWTGSPEREQSGRSTDIRIEYKHTVNYSENLDTLAHTHTHHAAYRPLTIMTINKLYLHPVVSVLVEVL